MKSNAKFSDDGYKFSFWLVKASGYTFFSVRNTKDGNVEFYRTWTDYLAFVLSFSFSFISVFCGVYRSFEIELKSAILGIGLTSFFQIAIINTVFTKVTNFLYSRRSFRIIYEFKWIDRLVRKQEKSW